MTTGILLWLSTALIDSDVGNSADNARQLLLLRFAVAPLLLLSLLVGWLKPEAYGRFMQPAAAFAGTVILWTIVSMDATAPDPSVFDYHSGLTGFAITILGISALLPIRFAYGLLACVPPSVGLVVVLATRFDYPPSLSLVWLGIANLAAGTAGLVLEQSRRRVFLYARSLAKERARSDQLLANLLPQSIAERLRREPGAIAESSPAVTVLFADIVGFTSLAGRMPPHDLVAALDRIFSAFDEMAERHGLEKIKTMGDAYMAVAGLPAARDDHAKAAAEMALEMRTFMAESGVVNGTPLSLRIGLHTGSVVAGVIGKKRLVYDLWGDTVNTASRMESHGLANEIQVTESVHEHLKSLFVFDERGVIEVKGKGPVRAFLLKARCGPRQDPGAPDASP